MLLIPSCSIAMSKKKKESFFWISYSDLMTSLFFILLALFVLSSAGLYMSEQATRKQLEKIEEIQQAVNRLPKQFFIEDDINKRWTLREEFTPHFASMDATIQASDTTKIINIGRSLMSVVDSLNMLKSNSEYASMDVKYMVVIEGMASNIKYARNDELSYDRALAVYYLWKRNQIDFENSDCEVQISGSGTRGIRPYNTEYYDAVKKGDPNAISKYDLHEEEKNQCIIIQIIPKISNIEK